MDCLVFFQHVLYWIHVNSIPVILNLPTAPETTQVFDRMGYTMLFVHIAHSLNKNGMMIPTKMEWRSQQKWNDDPNTNGIMFPRRMEWWSQQKWNDDPNTNGIMFPTRMEWWSQQKWNDDPKQKWNDDIKLVCFFSHPSINRGLQSVDVVHRFFRHSFMPMASMAYGSSWKITAATFVAILYIWNHLVFLNNIIPNHSDLDISWPRSTQTQIQFTDAFVWFGVPQNSEPHGKAHLTDISWGTPQGQASSHQSMLLYPSDMPLLARLATRSYKPKKMVSGFIRKRMCNLILGMRILLDFTQHSQKR